MKWLKADIHVSFCFKHNFIILFNICIMMSRKKCPKLFLYIIIFHAIASNFFVNIAVSLVD